MRAPPRNRRLAALVILLLLGLAAWLWSRPAPTPATTGDDRGPRSASGPTISALPPPVPQIELRLAGRASISGKVLDPRGGPVAGAQVCAAVMSELLSQREVWRPGCSLSARDGHYRIDGLWPVRTRVTASAPRHAPGIYSHGEGASRRETLDLRPAMDAINIDIVLEDGGVEITGVVRDLSGGPVEGARIVADRTYAQTDADGLFSAWVHPGPQMLVADADGYAPGLAHGLAPGHKFELFLTPEAVVVGKVVRADTGAPIEGARVNAGGQGWATSVEVTSDADGNFRIDGLLPGVYKPRAVSDETMGQAREQVILGLGETSTPVTIEAHPAFFVYGRIVGEGGSGCEEGFVSLQDRAHQRTLYGSPEVDGDVHMQGILPGTYEVRVGCTGGLAEASYDPITITDRSVSGVTWKVSRGRAIRGEVVDADGKPVAGVEVDATMTVDPKQPTARRASSRATTDAHGRFEISGLLPGRHELTLAGAREQPTQPTDVTLPDGRNLEGVRIELPATGEVRGSVLDPNGRPIAHSQVVLQDGPQQFVAAVADDGSFKLEHVTAGAYRAVAEAPHGDLRAPGEGDDAVHGEKIDVRAGKVETLNLVVEGASGVITGVVRDSDGGPIADAFVEAEREPESPAAAPQAMRRGSWGSLFAPHLTDADGRFTLTGLPPGKHTLLAHRRGGGEAIVEHVEPGSDVVLTIAPTSRLAGTVVLPGGPPPAELTVQLVQKDTGFERRDTFFRTGGAWSLPDLPPGPFKLRVESDAGTTEIDVTLRAGEDTTDLRVELTPKLTVRGTVLDLDGAPVPGMQVFIHAQNGGAYATGDAAKRNITDAAGRFELTGVPTGAVRVTAVPQDRSGEFGPTEIPMQISGDAATLELPPLRVPRKRIKSGQAEGDLGYKLAAPDAAADPTSARPSVVFVRPGSPAAAAGLQVGDEIVRVDGRDVTGPGAYLLNTLTTVPPGTAVTLSLARGVDLQIIAGEPP